MRGLDAGLYHFDPLRRTLEVVRVGDLAAELGASMVYPEPATNCAVLLVLSAVFWRSLARVGNADTVQVLGTPYCGKGEPSQTIRVGHASPACVFTGVDVFGGED